MDVNEQTFRHSSKNLLAMLILGAFSVFLGLSGGGTNYLCFSVAGLIVIGALFFATSSIKISVDEITTTRLFVSKSLRWSEVGRISIRGQTLRLHNRDEDVTLTLDSQLDDYNEVLDLVFGRRPDLFDISENNVLSGSWLRNVVLLGTGLVVITISIILVFLFEGFDKIFSLPLLLLGVYILWNWFSSPRRLTLDGKNLIVGYLLEEASYSADEIRSISYKRKRKPKSGYINYVQINLRAGDDIQFSLFEHGNAFAYQILKRWQQKTSGMA
ncbi:MAG TPA: hypothetical protein VHP14_10155 [Anaerolineales bacterium]|nr:hypothetical protein [Anaerolineales bacterium]